MRIYVGNLPYDVSDGELLQEFTAYGDVTSVTIMTDRISGRPKGFAFVEMAKKSEAEAAITGLNGKIINERAITVNEARPRTDSRGGGGSYGDRRSGGYGGGRSGGYSGDRRGRSSGGGTRRY